MSRRSPRLTAGCSLLGVLVFLVAGPAVGDPLVDAWMIRQHHKLALLHRAPPLSAAAAQGWGRRLAAEQLDLLARWEAAVGEEGCPDVRAGRCRDLLDRVLSRTVAEGDRLALTPFVDALAAALEGRPAAERRAFAPRLSAARWQLARLEERFDAEARRPDGVRRHWQAYLDGLKWPGDQAEAVAAEGRSAPPQGWKVATYALIDGADLPAKTVWLTFDDGPHPRYTAQVLDLLHRAGVRGAGFFQIGHAIERQKSWKAHDKAEGGTERVLAEGHLVGNHSYSHRSLPGLPRTRLTEEIERTNAVIRDLGGAPHLFRPPYGAFNPIVGEAAHAAGLKTVLWTIDSRDWADPVPDSIAERVLQRLRREGRGIILLHDIHPQSVAALRRILPVLRAEGFRFARWDGKEFVAGESPAPADPGLLLPTRQSALEAFPAAADGGEKAP